nr:transposon Ty3-I Gag-Pol polyprotein [Tanacetum cinerariifolium]
MCVDYRQLNKNTVKDKFSIPIIEELIDELHLAVVFSKLDLRSGYYQIKMYEEDIAKTQTMKEHATYLQMALETIRRHKLYAKLSKCVFMTTHVEYLGHNAFQWTSKAQLSFEALKKAMMEAPVLGLPDFNEPFMIETDVSGVGLGVVLPLAELCGHDITGREEAIQMIKLHLQSSRNRMKQQADKSRCEREFDIRDMVFLKLQPHRQVTIRMGKQNKFSQKFYGPFEGSLLVQPVKLLSRKMVKKNSKVVVYGLVQWANGTVDDASWEDLGELVENFPKFDLSS